MNELAGGIEHTNLGGNLLEDREASIRQPCCRYRSSPLVLWCARDDSNSNARIVGESDGWSTLEDTCRKLLDDSPGRISDHGLERRAGALATPRKKTQYEWQQQEWRPWQTRGGWLHRTHNVSRWLDRGQPSASYFMWRCVSDRPTDRKPSRS